MVHVCKKEIADATRKVADISKFVADNDDECQNNSMADILT